MGVELAANCSHITHLLYSVVVMARFKQVREVLFFQQEPFVWKTILEPDRGSGLKVSGVQEES